MQREYLTLEGQEKYDAIMREIETKFNGAPHIPSDKLSCELGNKPYQNIAEEYILKLNSLCEVYKIV